MKRGGDRKRIRKKERQREREPTKIEMIDRENVLFLIDFIWQDFFYC